MTQDPRNSLVTNGPTHGFVLEEDIPMSDGDTGTSAFRIRFTWKGLVFLGQYAVLVERENVSIDDFTALYNEAFAQAQKTVPWWFYRGLQAGYLVIPIIATHSPILMATPGARILSFDDPPVQQIAFEDLESVALVRDFLQAPERYLRMIWEDDA